MAIVEKIAEIYEIESQIRGLKPEQRLKVRREKSKGLVDEFFVGLIKALLLRLSNMLINNETALRRFLDNSNIEIDNNASERALRAIAIGGRTGFLLVLIKAVILRPSSIP